MAAAIGCDSIGCNFEIDLASKLYRTTYLRLSTDFEFRSMVGANCFKLIQFEWIFDEFSLIEKLLNFQITKFFSSFKNLDPTTKIFCNR